MPKLVYIDYLGEGVIGPWPWHVKIVVYAIKRIKINEKKILENLRKPVYNKETY